MTASVAGIVPEWTVGDRLRKARELTGLDRQGFAGDLGISRNSVANYETDKANHRKIVLRAWAMRCGVSLDWLLTGEVGPETDPGVSSPTNLCLSDGPVIIGPWKKSRRDSRPAA